MNNLKPPRILCILGGFMNLYIREIVSPLEVYEYKNLLKKIIHIKNVYIKKLLKKVLKIIIKLNYELLYYSGKIKNKSYKNYSICLIPVKKKNNSKIINKWIKQINNIKNNKKIYNIIISENLKKVELINNNFERKNKLMRKYLLIIMIDDVIKYICKLQNERIENKTIYILVNEYNKFNLEIIKQITNEVKNVNIITKELKKFLIFTNNIYKKDGILITVSNNSRKSLIKSKIIINLDFSEVDIRKYNINRNSIFINLKNENINLKGFSGIFISNLIIKKIINTDICELNKYNLFNFTNLYESFLYGENDLQYARKKIKEDGVKIECLVGKNGVINSKEYISLKCNS